MTQETPFTAAQAAPKATPGDSNGTAEDPRPPHERSWQRIDEVALVRYKLGLAKQGGDLCGEFAQMVRLALENGKHIEPPITYAEIGITTEELDAIIRAGEEKTARRIALLTANRPKKPHADEAVV